MFIGCLELLEKIDVVMCTYNSNTSYFEAVLRRISQEIPVHCFIVVDRLSSDGTVKRVLKVFPEAKIVLSKENLGRARGIGIGYVDTPFFVFIDSDVLLLKGWYEHTNELMKSGVGAVACFAKDAGEFNRELTYYQPTPRVVVSSKENMNSQRGWCYATLIRKQAVENWAPDKFLCAGEDHQLLRYVVKQGYLWVTSYFVFAKHLHIVSSYFDFYLSLWKKQKWNSAGLRYIKLIKSSPSQQLLRTMRIFLEAVQNAFLFGNALIIPHYFVYGLASFVGYVNWQKERFLYRENLCPY